MATGEIPYDAIIIGGGPAGLTAALYLGRARKRTLVLDRGQPRHAAAKAMHNFLTRDGMAPSELREVAWDQMAAYPSVEHRSGLVTTMTHDGSWRVTLEDGRVVRARAALLATGVVDEHPDIPGYEERWGQAIHHCPYCHGWELKDLPLALLGAGEAIAHMAPLLRGWSDDVVVLTHGVPLAPDVRSAVEGFEIYEAEVVGLTGPGCELHEVALADGTKLARRGLFVVASQRQVSLVTDLDLALTEDGYVEVDLVGATSFPMLWAAGDLTTRMQQVVEAAAQGARAGAMMNLALT